MKTDRSFERDVTRETTRAPMPEETLVALRGSIEKWEAIVAGTGADAGTGNCPLCHLFYENSCRGCPVNDVSKNGCASTPYIAWSEGLVGHRGPALAKTPELVALAQVELDFLRSLLPGGSQAEAPAK